MYFILGIVMLPCLRKSAGLNFDPAVRHALIR